MLNLNPQSNGDLRVTQSANKVVVQNRSESASVVFDLGKNRGKTIYIYKLPKKPGSAMRPRKTFRKLAEAKDFAGALLQGQLGNEVFARLTSEQLRELTLIAETLKPFCAKLNIGLSQAIHEYIQAKELSPARLLSDVVGEYLTQPWVTKRRTTFSQVKEAFLDAKKRKKCADETLRTLRYSFERFERQFNDPLVRDITSDQLNERIHRPDREARGNKTVYCSFHNLFGWMQRNGYLRPDQPTAMDAVESPIVKLKPPAIITVPEAKHAIQILAAQSDPEYLLVFVFSLFSGIRADELQEMLMKYIEAPERIRVPGDVSKTVERFMPILPVLEAWMKPFYGRGGYLNSRKDPQIRIGAILKKAGIAWKRNWLRHSYCSYRLCDTGKLLQTSKESGHSPEILAKRYLQIVTESQAQAYFALTPEACGILDWPERVARFIALTGECHELTKRKPKKRLEQNLTQIPITHN